MFKNKKKCFLSAPQYLYLQNDAVLNLLQDSVSKINSVDPEILKFDLVT